MIVAVTVGVSFLFSAFVFLDVVSIYPRVAGGILGKNAIGYSFQGIVTTIKRIFIVLYPPLLGILAISGSLENLFAVIAFAYCAAIFAVVLCLLIRKPLISYFCSAIDNYAQGSSLTKSFFGAFTDGHKYIDRVSSHIADAPALRFGAGLDNAIFLFGLWIFFFYGASVFMVNILNFLLPTYSSVILQTTGLVNAMGSLAFAFLLDPRLSRLYEAQQDMMRAANSLAGAHLINLVFLSPAVFVLTWASVV